MPFITTKAGTEIFYKDTGGAGQPIVFSHGWPLSSDDWDSQIFYFASRGFRCIAHDRRGHGRSTATWDKNEMDTYSDDLAELTAKLDLKDAVGEFMTTFEAFKGSNDEKLAQLESRFGVDVLTGEKDMLPAARSGAVYRAASRHRQVTPEPRPTSPRAGTPGRQSHHRTAPVRTSHAPARKVRPIRCRS